MMRRIKYGLRVAAALLAMLTVLVNLPLTATAVNKVGTPEPIKTAYVSEGAPDVSYIDPLLAEVDGAVGGEKITFATYEATALANSERLIIRVEKRSAAADSLPVYLLDGYEISDDLTYNNMPTLGYLDYVGELDLTSGVLDISGLSYAGEKVTFAICSGYRENFDAIPAVVSTTATIFYDGSVNKTAGPQVIYSDIQLTGGNGSGRGGVVPTPVVVDGSFAQTADSRGLISGAVSEENNHCLALMTSTTNSQGVYSTGSNKTLKLFNLLKLSNFEEADLGKTYHVKCEALTATARDFTAGIRNTGSDVENYLNKVSLGANSWQTFGFDITVTAATPISKWNMIEKQLGLVHFTAFTSNTTNSTNTADGTPIYIDNVVVTRPDVSAGLFAAPSDDITPSIDDAQILLGKSLTLNIYTTLPQTMQSAKLAVERNGNVKILEGSITANGKVYSYEAINPQCMGDLLNITLFLDSDGNGKVGDGEVLAVYHDYSVRTYCLDMLASKETQHGMTKAEKALLDALIRDLLVYGGAAQRYIGYKTDALADAGITGSDFIKPTVQKKLVTTDKTHASFASANVLFANTNSLIFEVKTEDITKTELRIGTKTYTVGEENKEEEGIYAFVTDALYATAFGDMLTVELIYDGAVAQTLNYGMSCYIAGMADREDEMGKLARATYNYGVSASHYGKSGELELSTIQIGESLADKEAEIDFWGKGSSITLNCSANDMLTLSLDGIKLKVAVKVGANTVTLPIPEGYHTLSISGSTATLESVTLPGFEAVHTVQRNDKLIVKLLAANADGHSESAPEAYRSFHVYTPTSDPSGKYFVRYQFAYEYNDTRDDYRVNQCTNVSNYRIKTAQLVSMDYAAGVISNEKVESELLGNGELSFAVKDKDDSGKDHPDFVGGFHGDERLSSAVLEKDGDTVDLLAVGAESVFECNKLVFYQTTTIYRNSTSGTEIGNYGTEMADHMQTFTISADGITNSRKVTWLGSFNLVQCYMQMFPLLREDGENRVADSFVLYKADGSYVKDVKVVSSEIPAGNNTWTRSASFRQAVFHDSGESGVMAYCSYEYGDSAKAGSGVSGIQHRTQGDNKLYASALSEVGESNASNGNATVAPNEVWSSIAHFGIDYITPGVR